MHVQDNVLEFILLLNSKPTKKRVQDYLQVTTKKPKRNIPLFNKNMMCTNYKDNTSSDICAGRGVYISNVYLLPDQKLISK